MNKPIFETFANATIDRVKGTYEQRGTEYGDTWAHCQWLALKATCRKLGLEIPESKLRAVAAAVLFDVKYQRLEGGYKDDSVVDGMAYGGLWAEEMRRQEADREAKIKILSDVAETNGHAIHRNGQFSLVK